jgi:hypothetical protein
LTYITSCNKLIAFSGCTMMDLFLLVCGLFLIFTVFFRILYLGISCRQEVLHPWQLLGYLPITSKWWVDGQVIHFIFIFAKILHCSTHFFLMGIQFMIWAQILPVHVPTLSVQFNIFLSFCLIYATWLYLSYTTWFYLPSLPLFFHHSSSHPFIAGVIVLYISLCLGFVFGFGFVCTQSMRTPCPHSGVLDLLARSLLSASSRDLSEDH